MILDELKNSNLYENVHPDFKEAFAFLKKEGLNALPEGKHEIDGDRIFAMVVRAKGGDRENAKLEVHRKYIDIQFVVNGNDLIGWKITDNCSKVDTEYNEEGDAALYTDKPDAWLALKSNMFAIFYPDDAHAPLAGTSDVHKIIVKVRL